MARKTKFCWKCKRYKKLKLFNKNRTKWDGLTTECTLCVRKHSNFYYKTTKQSLIWYRNNREKILKKKKEYIAKNRKMYNKKQVDYRKKNINARLAFNLRIRINQALKYSYKRGSAVKDLGCSVEYLKKHLESKFKTGMTWKNYGYGKNKWHIDHIKPLSKFKLSNRKQFLLACHYTNLQPLWQKENLKKSAKWE